MRWRSGIGATMLALALTACGRDGAPRCGDGVVDPGEACDDGNHRYDDDCLPGCVAPSCGDGHLWVGVEPCDSAGTDDCTCDADCTLPACGDGHLNRSVGEVCDDGNTVSADGCRADCRSDETCGNRVVDGHLPRTRATDPQLCLDANTQGTGCAEVCDDGNRVSGDGCSENCLSEETCANGIVDPFGDGGRNLPETCDDGNFIDSDLCGRDCQAQPDGPCGNRRLNAGEQCDRGTTQTAFCDQSPDRTDPQNCTFARCGDGHVNPLSGEECDDGDPRLDGNCPSCREAICGDGVTDRTLPILEACDAGSQNGQAGVPCSIFCQVVVP